MVFCSRSSIAKCCQGDQLQADLIVYGAIASAYESQWRRTLHLFVEVEGARLETDIVMHNEAAWSRKCVHLVRIQTSQLIGFGVFCDSCKTF